MTHAHQTWIIPASLAVYNLKACLTDRGFVDWSQHFSPQIGDIVYIYATAPEQKIICRTRVEKTHMPFQAIKDDRIYWRDEKRYEASQKNIFCRLRLVSFLEEDVLSLADLKKNGLRMAPRRAVKVDDALARVLAKVNARAMKQSVKKDTFLETIITALEDLGGVAPLTPDIYREVKRIRLATNQVLPATWKAIIRGRIQEHSSDSQQSPALKRKWIKEGKTWDYFYKAEEGVWGLRWMADETAPVDYDEPDQRSRGNQKVKQTVSRYVRDTLLSKKIKRFEKHQCQVCGATIRLPNGQFYSEAHHIQPLGKGHQGEDRADNIIIVCPSCHAKLDYLVMSLDLSQIHQHAPKQHQINQAFIDYHNRMVKKAYRKK